METLAALKDRALGVPWLLSQKAELAKVYFSWIAICRVGVLDWGEESDEVVFVENELAECMENVGGREIFRPTSADIQTSTLPMDIFLESWQPISKGFWEMKMVHEMSGIP